MPDKKSNTETKAASSEKTQGKIRIHNRFAGRPLSFQVPGKSMRLGPGESETLPKEFLNAYELQCLCHAGLVVVEDLTTTRPVKHKKSDKTLASEGRPPDEPERKETEEAPKAAEAGSKAKPSSKKDKPSSKNESDEEHKSGSGRKK